MSLTEEQITAKNFQNFYELIYPYLNGAAHAGFTPVGTVIAYYGETAPQNYLACDGTAYNKVDYPELWTHLSSLSDTTPYVVDGDNTKFKVPDLQGEFLRGNGTNSHTNQGNGANVGVHQDSTEIPILMGGVAVGICKENDSKAIEIINRDSTIGTNFVVNNANRSNVSSGSNDGYRFTSRPTNTSVLWCIATKDIYVDARFDYSTTEKVVGKWIDGKPVYQNTIILPNHINIIGPNGTTITSVSQYNIEALVDCVCYGVPKNDDISTKIYQRVAFPMEIRLDTTNQTLIAGVSASNIWVCALTIRYTKTTD